MAKEIYIYSSIFNFTSEDFISKMEEFKDDDVVVRINSLGGDVFAGWGMAAKLKQHQKGVTVKVDGIAASMAGFLIVFAKQAEALNVSKIMLHRAEFNGFGEPSSADLKLLKQINEDLRAALESKINQDKFREITGKTLTDLFESETRIDVWLTAQEALEIGLIQKVVAITSNAFQATALRIAAMGETVKMPEAIIKTIDIIMLILRFQSLIYKQAITILIRLSISRPDFLSLFQAIWTGQATFISITRMSYSRGKSRPITLCTDS